jgi:hypothetical protein
MEPLTEAAKRRAAGWDQSLRLVCGSNGPGALVSVIEARALGAAPDADAGMTIGAQRRDQRSRNPSITF